MASKKAITTREKDYSQWYLDIVEAAEMAEHSVVRGCMVIKPYGYALWENFQKVLDGMIKETGHKNSSVLKNNLVLISQRTTLAH